MADFNAENDRLLYNIEHYLINNKASDFLHYFLRFNYDIILGGRVTRILTPVDAALQRLVDRVGKSLDVISILPEGKDVLTNFLSSTEFSGRYPVYTAINGTTYGKTTEDLKQLKTSGSNKFGEIEIWIIDGIISRNEQQIGALTRANPPQYAVRRSGIIGDDPTTNFDDFPNPVIRQIALNLPLTNIINICKISIQFNLSICDSEDFWNEKTRRDHPTNRRGMIGGNWKETYHRLSGRLYTFGNGANGRLGLGDARTQSFPRIVESLINVTAVSCGGTHTAVISNGRLYTFGDGEFGQLGHGNHETQLNPKLVESLNNVTAVSCGDGHTVVIADGQLYTFGKGGSGQLGHGDYLFQNAPKLVEGLNNVTFIACGFIHTAAISDGHLYTFGSGGGGGLGHGDEYSQPRPKMVEGLDNVISVACGNSYTAVIISNGRLYTFGYNTSGELGNGDNLTQLRPVFVSWLDNVTSVACGSHHTAAIANGLLYTFGSGSYGQLGHNNENSYTRPKLVNRLENVTVTAVACGDSHTAVITSNNKLYTFGTGYNGSLGHGNGAAGSRQYTPTLIQVLHNVMSVSAGRDHTAAIVSSDSYKN